MTRPARILLVDDNEADIVIACAAIDSLNLNVEVTTSTSGAEALRALAVTPRDELPALVLLDLNMPGMDGLEVLDALKGHRGLKQLPVVMFTTSRDQRDVQRAYELGVNAYVTKPMSLDETARALSAVLAFWVTLNERPEPPAVTPGQLPVSPEHA